MQKHLSQSGFTLVELIIAIVIVTVITTFGIASFTSASRASAVQRQAQELKSLARKIRTDATAASKPSGSCETSGVVYGTYIAFQTGTANYTYGISCFNSATPGTPVTGYGTQISATLPTGMLFASASRTILYFFDGNVGALGTYGAPVAADFIAANYLAANYPLQISDVPSGWPGPRDYRLSFSPSGLVCEEKWTTNLCAN